MKEERTEEEAMQLMEAVQRERQLDRYRESVEQYLGKSLALASDEDFAQFFRHIERCFDWGVSAPACGRTWLAKRA
jgi:hypothetical protein